MAISKRFVALFAVLTLLVGCPTTTTTPTLSISPAAVSLAIGETRQLRATSSDPLDTFQWSSSTSDIVAVSVSGVVTALAEGNATITVRGSNSQLSKSIPVAVPSAPSFDISVTPTKIVLRPTRTATLAANSTDTGDAFTWSSSDTGIASIDTNGTVTAIAEGETSIVVTGSRSKATNTVSVTVSGTLPAGIDVTPAEIVLQPTQTTALTAASTDTEDVFTWSSSDTDIAMVDAGGVVTALAAGEATITTTGSRSQATGIAFVTVFPTPLVDVTVSPARVVLQATQTVTLAANSTSTEDTFTWLSSDTRIATVDASATVTAVAEGTVTITAVGSPSEAVGTASITVVAAPPASISLTPIEIVLHPTLTATLVGASTDPADTLTWSSSDTTVATVDAAGTVTAVAEGNATITVQGTNSGATRNATVTVEAVTTVELRVTPAEIVLQAGETSGLKATSTDTTDTFAWSSSDTAIATVDASGNVTAVAEGGATIAVRGSNSGVTRTALVTVAGTPSVEIIVTPAEIVLMPLETTTLAATSTDGADTFAWSSSDSTIATVDSSGIVTAIAEGQAAIAVTGNNSGITRTALVRVVGIPSVDIAVTPAEIVLRPTGTTTLEATSTDGADTFTWSSSDSTIATVDTNGTVTAVAEGQAAITVTGSNSGVTSTALITVLGMPPAAITVAPAEIVLRPTLNAMLVASSTDTADTFTWSSSDTTIATVDASGVVTAIVDGTATITALGSNSGDTGTTLVTVAGSPPAEISITPAEIVLRPTLTTTLMAISTDGTDTFTWSSSDTAVATVDNSGTVTAVAEGLTTIVARGSNSEAVGTTSVTVAGSPPADISITPAEIVLRPTLTTTLTATSTDGADTFTWSSSDTAIATVDSNGTVTAVAEGLTTIVARGSNSEAVGTASVTVAGSPPADITVTPAETVLRPTLTTTLLASSTSGADTFTWSSFDTSIATVDANGTVTAVAAGQVSIVAKGSDSEAVGTASITVSGRPPADISIIPAEIVLRPTLTTSLTATSTDTEDTFIWSSTDTSTVTVDTNGTVTAIAAGQATITASGTASGDSSTALVNVSATEIAVTPAEVVLRPTRTAALEAISTDVTDTFVWSSSDTNIATIDSNGIVTAIAVGNAAITADGVISGASGTSLVTVSGTAPAGIDISPAAIELQPTLTAALAATSTDTADAFTWSSSDDTIAAVDASGIVTAIAVGTVTITAQGTNSEAIGSASVTVSGSAPVGISVTPAETTLRAGETATLSATSSDPADTFSWSSSNNSIATIDGNGTVTAVAEGVVSIEARGNNSGAVGMATVTVSGVVAEVITVTPVETTLRPTESVILSAASTDGADTFTWSSSDGSVAAVTPDGTVVAIAGGTATITALGSNSGVSGMATITVSGTIPADIAVTPTETTLRPLESVALSATSTDTGDAFTWSSSDTGIATVDVNGMVSAVAEGTATIIAMGTASGDTGSAVITVSGRPLADITVAPAETAFRVGEVAVLSATSTDTEDSFVWTSSDTTVATVVPGGSVVAIGVGVAQITATGTASGDRGNAQVTVGSASVALTSSQLPLPIGAAEVFTASSTDPNDITFTWTSSNTNVATVSGTGVVLAAAEGTTTIRAVGTTSNSAGLMELTVVPTVTSLLLWDGENGYTGANGVLNSAEAFRGTGCLEATPTKFSSPTIGFIDYPGYRSDLSALDEIWFFAKADMTGRTTDFRVRGLSGQSNTVNIDGYIDGGALDLTYRLVRIPIADLQTDTYSLDNVENIFFGVALPSQGHKFYIDDVWAVSLAAFDVSSYPLMGSVPALSFGDVAVHSTASQEITLTNIGTGTLSVHKVSITGAQADEFFVSETAFDIAPGATHVLTVSFTPATVLNKATGDKSATLVVAHSLTPMSSSTTVSLRGRAVSPAISVSNDAMDFGSIAIGQSATRTLSISNPGNAPLTVSSVMTSNASFTATPTSFTLNPDTSQVVTVVFTPTMSASYAETVTLLSNAVDTETIAVDLAATGLPADTVGLLTVEADGITSSSIRLSWPQLDQAASVRVYLGPEPSATANADLPLQTLLDTLVSDATAYTALDLAPAVDVFFHIEVLDSSSAVLAEGNAYAHTVGGPLAVLDNPVREIHLVAPNVLQVIVANDAVHSFSLRSDVSDGGIDRIVGDTGEDLQAGSWSITRNDGSPIGITSVYRQSVPTGTPYYESGVDVDPSATTGLLRLNLIDLDHQLYFVLEEPVGNREILTVLGPEITRETMSFDFEIGQETFQPSFILPFSDRHLETTVIQVNQVGYSPIATERYAYISGWMGDGGPLSLTGFPSQASVLVDDENPLLRRAEAVTALAITERSAMDNDSGTEVREIDLSSVPAAEGVIYRAYIPGVGVSFPTQVSETAVFKAFYVTARGLFFNRWGRDLKPEWTEWSPRPPDHPFVFTADTGDFLLERTAFTENTPQTGQRTLAGGHHDAADYDIRGQHFLVPLYLMRIYELHPETFLDNQLTIPESGNGIPDLLDEILWSLSAWEQLQEEDGGIRGGVESYAHPSLINFTDLDVLPYWTFTRSAYHTMRVAGLFAQAARLVEPFDPDKSAELLGRAVAAYQYAMANGVTEATTGPPMYAASELYRMTGEAEYRDVFESIWIAGDSFGLGPSVYPFAPWAASYALDSQPILLDYVFGYLLSPDPDPVFLEESFTRFDRYVGDAIEAINTQCAHRSARMEATTPNFGKGAAVGEYVMRVYSRYMLGNMTTEEEQTYLNAISLSADYVLGCNALGRVWLTGLGSRPPTSHQHGESQTFRNAGFGFMPGISIYGPRSGLPNTSTYDFARQLFYPLFEELPLMRRYGDVGSWAGTAEFTIFETQAPHIALFGALLGPGMLPPDSWLPYGKEHRNPLAPREDATSTGP